MAVYCSICTVSALFVCLETGIRSKRVNAACVLPDQTTHFVAYELGVNWLLGFLIGYWALLGKKRNTE